MSRGTGILSDLKEAGVNLRAQKTRTFLTALGIVFGVGSVIGMLAIGAGARDQSLSFIEQLGVRNILVDSRPAMSAEELQQRRRSSQGLNERDVRVLQANVEGLDVLSPRRALHPSRVLPKPAGPIPALYGVRPSYAVIHNLHPSEGRLLTEEDDRTSSPVCVLGEAAKIAMLGFGAGVGQYVKVNDSWLHVVGVLKEQFVDTTLAGGGRVLDRNNAILIPLNTFQYRFWDTSRFLKDELDGVDLRLKPEVDSVKRPKWSPPSSTRRTGIRRISR